MQPSLGCDSHIPERTMGVRRRPDGQNDEPAERFGSRTHAPPSGEAVPERTSLEATPRSCASQRLNAKGFSFRTRSGTPAKPTMSAQGQWSGTPSELLNYTDALPRRRVRKVPRRHGPPSTTLVWTNGAAPYASFARSRLARDCTRSKSATVSEQEDSRSSKCFMTRTSEREPLSATTPRD
jgi:hypothetical protein